VAVRTPRDREGSFDPKLVAKRQTRLAGLDDRILGLYAGGMSVRDIEDHSAISTASRSKRDTISRVPTRSSPASRRGARGGWTPSTRSPTSTA
jgi:putative transposase